jgi:hypothetical protein
MDIEREFAAWRTARRARDWQNAAYHTAWMLTALWRSRVPSTDGLHQQEWQEFIDWIVQEVGGEEVDHESTVQTSRQRIPATAAAILARIYGAGKDRCSCQYGIRCQRCCSVLTAVELSLHDIEEVIGAQWALHATRNERRPRRHST